MAGVTAIVGSLRSGLTAAVGTQVVLTVASLGYATGRLGGTPSPLLQSSSSSKGGPEEVFDAHHYDFVTEFVTGMYAGRGTSHPYVKLADGDKNSVVVVSFEDPAARSCGAHEVREAFRALKYLEPRSIRPPCCVDVQPQGESIALSYALDQQYLDGRLHLQSLLVIKVQLRQRKDVPESEFLVLQMEEHWNGIPFWNSYLFWIVRRINGMVSWQLTKRIL